MRLKNKFNTHIFRNSTVTSIMKQIFVFVLIGLLYTSCYSFRGVSIPAEVDTFYVRQVRLSDFAAPPDTPERFMEQFREKVRSQSSLKWDETDPHIEFDCEIIGFRVSNEGNQQGNEVSLNKLTISVKVQYINNLDEEDTWNKTISFGIPFDPSEDLQEVQDGYITDIFDQISENIFNDAFTNW